MTRRCGDCGRDPIVLVRTATGLYCRRCLYPCTCVSSRNVKHQHGPTGCLVAGCGCTATTEEKRHG